MMKAPILFVPALLLAQLSFSQKVTATADRHEILIGEQFTLRLQANFLTGEPVKWFEIDSIPGFEILRRASIDTVVLNDGLALSQQFLMTSWDSGKIELPSLVLDNWKTAAITINVAYSPSPFDTSQPYHEIKEILEVKKTTGTKWYWYLIFALLIIALFLLFFPKAKKKANAGFVPDEGAYKKAMRSLAELRSSNAEASIFYTQLVHILREYLHRRKNIQSFSKTTDDLGIQLQQLRIDREAYNALLQVLRLSDLVKFARFQPTREENENAVGTIQQSIVTIENMPNAV